MFKLMVGFVIIIAVIGIMAFTGTYISNTHTTDLMDNIDTSTEYGHRANQTMQNMSKDFDSSVEAQMMMAMVMVITLPLATIIILKKLI